LSMGGRWATFKEQSPKEPARNKKKVSMQGGEGFGPRKTQEAENTRNQPKNKCRGGGNRVGLQKKKGAARLGHGRGKVFCRLGRLRGNGQAKGMTGKGQSGARGGGLIRTGKKPDLTKSKWKKGLRKSTMDGKERGEPQPKKGGNKCSCLERVHPLAGGNK